MRVRAHPQPRVSCVDETRMYVDALIETESSKAVNGGGIEY